MSLLYYVNKGIHIKFPNSSTSSYTVSSINSYSSKILDSVIHYCNLHTTFNYKQTRDTQRNALLLSTSPFLQYRTYLHLHTDVTEFHITSWSCRLHKGILYSTFYAIACCSRQQVLLRLLFQFQTLVLLLHVSCISYWLVFYLTMNDTESKKRDIMF
jgi:hypothetical protein